MNKIRRQNLMRVRRTLNALSFKPNEITVDALESIRDDIENLKFEEEMAYDNFPENLQYSMKGQEMENAIERMSEAVDHMEELIRMYGGDVFSWYDYEDEEENDAEEETAESAEDEDDEEEIIDVDIDEVKRVIADAVSALTDAM